MSEVIKFCKKHGDLNADQVRMRSNGKQMCMSCKQCDRDRVKKHRDNNLDLERKRKRELMQKNKEKYKPVQDEYRIKNKAKLSEAGKQYKLKHREKIKVGLKKAALKRKFNISIEEFENMILSQNNLCAICDKPESRINHRSGAIQNLAIDHNHKNGKIRQLLCSKCNLIIGQINEDIEILQSMITYLKKYNN